MRDSNDHEQPESDQVALGELNAEPHSDWDVLSTPLDRRSLDAIIDHSIAQRSRREASPPKAAILRPARWLPAVAFGGALAAGLTLLIRTEEGSQTSPLEVVPARADPVEPFVLDVRSGNTQLRGEARSVDERREYEMRNEPLWAVHATPGTATDAQLYLVARTASGMELLRPRIEHKGLAFRVLGEVREIGMRPGDGTVYFVLGPAGSEAEVVSRVRAYVAGMALPIGWQVKSLRLHIEEE